MKRYLLFAAGIAILFSLATSWQPLKAQVYGDFDTVRIRTGAPYQELDPSTDIPIPAAAWGLPPNWIADYDDGYAYPTGVDIGFPFEFNGEVYTRVWICINGFITFTPPPFVPAKVPNALFVASSSYPVNVVAPFWGDHVYRLQNEKLNQYTPSRISYFTDNDVFTVQWKDLNINDGTVKSSYANFQVKLYKSQDQFSDAGNIEFCYGPVATNPLTNQTFVITKNSSIGLKGETGDFLNGLTYGQDPLVSRTSTQLTIAWPPSDGATDRRILFTALGSRNIEDFWGDGDVDFSKGKGGKHYGLVDQFGTPLQNRYVTVNDARLIMRSIATAIPLDSIRRRQAYHGDVNHNGRYWYDNNGIRADIYWKNTKYNLGLPQQVGSLKRIFFQANEWDAALILHYISGRLTQLPWMLDTIPMYGRISADNVANNIKFGDAKKLDNVSYQVPVYINGYLNGPIAFKFDVNGKISNVEGTIYTSNQMMLDHNESTVVVTGDGEFDGTSPICLLTVQSDKPELNASNIRFNDVNVGETSTNLMTVNESDNTETEIVMAQPNVFDTKTFVTLNAPKSDYYDLAIYDAIGSRVKTLSIGNLVKGFYSFEWTGLNDAGSMLQSGVYFIRLNGSNVSISQKLLLNR